MSQPMGTFEACDLALLNMRNKHVSNIPCFLYFLAPGVWNKNALDAIDVTTDYQPESETTTNKKSTGALQRAAQRHETEDTT
jgi:hypothetical protein